MNEVSDYQLKCAYAFDNTVVSQASPMHVSVHDRDAYEIQVERYTIIQC
jgi:hypothetical protein